jgi:spore coat polysaccharide biosynthesis protein SpsF
MNRHAFRVGALIQARMSSTRLPGKVMRPLAGKAILLRIVERLRRCAQLDEIIVVTSDDSSDDTIARHCDEWRVACFRGSLNDVLDRYYQAATLYRLDVVVRITADCPLTDPQLVDRVILMLLASETGDFASNGLIPRYPRGTDVAVMRYAALARSWREATQPYERVHVTPYIKQHPQIFHLLPLVGERDYSHYRLTVDTAEDLQLIEAIFARLVDREGYTLADVIALLEREPALVMINQHIQQKRLEEL